MNALTLRFTGAWHAMSAADRAALLDRGAADDAGVRDAAAEIVADVRRRGDDALFDLARRYDGVSMTALEVPRAKCERALSLTDPELRRALERAAANVARVHAAFRPMQNCVSSEAGVTIVRRPDALQRVGVYAPGGRAAYASSVIMTAVPARVAGVGEILLASPPTQDGCPASVVLAAAAIAGVDRVFAMGGAGAVAAMAFGTASVPRVDRIVGPGNAYVAAAKTLVASGVGIDCPAGPSEIVVIADATCDPRAVAMELVAQAEHDPRALAVALVVGASMAARIERELAAACADAPRTGVVAQALAALGAVLTVRDLREAVAAANDIAPEHLLLATEAPDALVTDVRNAGSVFVGGCASVVFGDYLTGANHVLPTGGAARAWSGLSPLDFVRWTTIQYVTRDGAAQLSADTARLAHAEALPAHAAAALHWKGSAA